MENVVRSARSPRRGRTDKRARTHLRRGRKESGAIALQDPGPAGATLPLEPRRQPRSRDTVAAILEAARQVFEEVGYAGATTNRIAERAGVSIGSLYQYFPNKGALLRALGAEHHREVHAVVAAAVAHLADPGKDLKDLKDLEVGLRTLLEGLVGLHQARPGLHRVLADDVDSGLAGSRRKDEAEHFGRILGALLRARPEVRVGDPEVAAHLVVHTVEAVARWLGHQAPPGLDRQAVIAELVEILHGYLVSQQSRSRPAARFP